jgi:hypothetical protein
MFGLALLAAAAALTQGCADDRSPPAAPSIDDPLVAQLGALGFRTDMIEDRGDYFLVEGDIEISKRSIPRLAAAPPVRTLDLAHETPGMRRVWDPKDQWRTTVLVSQSQAPNIRVSLTGLASQPAWQTAARQALTEWNNLNCSNVRLVEGTPAVIAYTTYTTSSSTAAQATFPADAPAGSGLPGPTIRANTAFSGSSSARLLAMVHEIGHTLGFRHTNWQARGEPASPYGAHQVSGTPATDLASMMNGGAAGDPWIGFSFYDRVAVKVLYPNTNPTRCITSNFVGPSQAMPYQTCTFSANPTGGTPPYAYSWMGGAFGSAKTYLYRNAGSSFAMRLTIRDASNRTEYVWHPVNVYQYNPPC